MKIFDRFLNVYFKIPRWVRFLMYYMIALIIFINQGNELFNNQMGSSLMEVFIKDFATGPLRDAAKIGSGVSELGKMLLGWYALILMYFFFSLPITIILFVGRNVRIRIKRDNKRYSAKENILYYREILNDIPPAIISIIDNFKIEPEKDMLGGVLKLVLTGHAKFENNILKVVDKNTDKLPSSQRVLFNMIRDGKIDNRDSERWKNICYEEAEKSGYVLNIKDKKENHAINHMNRGTIILSIGVFSLISLMTIASEFGGERIAGFFLFLAVLFFVFYFCYVVFYSSYYLLRKSDFRYTKKGEEAKDRIDGLKRFIHDYTSLDEKDKKEVVLWDEFLIYALIFEQNKSILKDMLKMRGLDTNIDFDSFYFEKNS